uniref:solute carrier family 13 member 5-like isoform X2 n=1 Tax=Ciona intestinalis TaxID=7719 RepID=UPI000180CB5D|nr:solute carrier family 13 member 5-like isoform X2 [Ciona intestinalis]|eukprot:XP_009860115.1 solute carrier family 13 member 5-like isoform X2 [Ciona intestinalis]
MAVPMVLRQIWAFRNTLYIIIPPILLLPIPIIINSTEASCGYAILLMAIYWITEAIPLAATAFLPLIIFPLSGVMTASAVSAAYFTDTAWLFVGGLIIAVSVEVTGLHKRIALRVLLFVGAKPRCLMFGFMMTTYFLSMWISNTATTAMMLPIVEAVFRELKAGEEKRANEILDKLKTQRSHDTNAEVDSGKASTSFCNRSFEDNDQNENKNEKESQIADFNDVIFIPDDIETEEQRNKRMDNLIKGITLCVPYAASIGGTATVTGTGPNLVLSGQFATLFPDATMKLSFGSWIAYALPGSVCMLILAYIWLSLYFLGFNLREIVGCFRGSDVTEGERNARNVIVTEYKKLGDITWKEVTVLSLFTTTALLWFFRDPGFMPGWSILFEEDYVDDGTVAMTMAFLLFVLPSERPSFLRKSSGLDEDDKSEDSVSTMESDELLRPVAPILDWKTVHHKFPWAVMLLITGGFAMAKGATESGFSEWLGDQLIFLGGIETWAICLIVTIVVCLFTECSSNVATASIFVPILAQLAQSLEVHPLYLMLPPVLAASLAFMLPVATPPNALAFSYGHLKVMDLIKAGWMLNVLGVLVISVFINTYGVSYFGLNEFPAWAALPKTSGTTAAPTFNMTSTV